MTTTNVPKELPTGVIYSKVVNIIGIVLSVLILLILALILGLMSLGRPMLEQELRKEMQGMQVGMPPGFDMMLMVVLLVGIIFVLTIACIIGTIFINRGLSKLDRSARIWQIILSVGNLFFFPIGTVLYGISLYFMLFDERTKKAFEPPVETAQSS